MNFKRLTVSASLAAAALLAGSYLLPKAIDNPINSSQQKIETKHPNIYPKHSLSPKIIVPPSISQLTGTEKPLEAKLANNPFDQLFTSLIEGEKQGDFSKFHETINSIKGIRLRNRPNLNFVFSSGIHPKELDAYLNNDLKSLLENSIKWGNFIDSSVLAYELDFPQEVIEALYNKGRKFNTGNREYLSLPFIEENFTSQQYFYWRRNLDLTRKISERSTKPLFLKLIENFPGKTDLRDFKDYLKHYNLDQTNPIIASEVDNQITELREKFISGDANIFTLEKVAAGYQALNMPIAASEFVNYHFDEIYYKLLTQSDVKDKAEHLYLLENRLEKFKRLLPKEKYHYWNSRLQEMITLANN